MSRFVSAGTTDNPVEHDEAWLKAQQQVEAQRKPKQDIEKHDSGNSLYEVLQANKAAKQDAFEESIRLKNQFRALKDDEVEFLESVNETTRAKELAAKQEIAQQLETFRNQRQAAEQAELEDPANSSAPSQATVPPEAWATRKRKKKERDGLVPKIRKLSETTETTTTQPTASPIAKELIKGNANQTSSSLRTQGTGDSQGKHPTVRKDPDVPPAKANLGLVAYSSDEE